MFRDARRVELHAGGGGGGGADGGVSSMVGPADQREACGGCFWGGSEG
ncbi:unnamed protein product [Linum tenue]|uniref:Uncharacterized protein n=1 Tax=Linum tenue TaxID=586396 RepID=A0AAV0MHA9_9ROSI|nr:unnamed protein product [Linum tenue]